MKTKIHAIAGGVATLMILLFWTSTVFTELFASHEAVASLKGWILRGMFILIPAMMIVGGSGMALGGKRQDADTLRKKKRMPIIAATGLLILLPAAIYLEWKASRGAFDLWFYLVQLIELIAGASNFRLMVKNICDGLRLTGKLNDQPGRFAGGSTGEVAIDDIKVVNNGPLMLNGAISLTDASGAPVSMTKKHVALCRCGASKNKPFCDGSHNDIGFDDSISASRTPDEVKVYAGKNLDVHYNKLLCSHGEVCGTQLKAVFNSGRDPWIDPDQGDTEAIKAVIRDCPSGALRYAKPGQLPQHERTEGTGVSIEKNGPYRVLGIPFEGGNPCAGACPDKYALCRCGLSKNKPYCDGSHSDVGWSDN